MSVVGGGALALFVYALISWSLAVGYFPRALPGLSPAAYVAGGVVAALLLFASVLLRELSHSLVAQREGLGVTRDHPPHIFGGVSQLDGEPPSPGGVPDRGRGPAHELRDRGRPVGDRRRGRGERRLQRRRARLPALRQRRGGPLQPGAGSRKRDAGSSAASPGSARRGVPSAGGRGMFSSLSFRSHRLDEPSKSSVFMAKPFVGSYRTAAR